MRSWRLPLRMAWRDARRSRARSALVLVMIALPVLGVTTADVLIQTSDVDAVERIDRSLGPEGQAMVTIRSGWAEVEQHPAADYVGPVRREPGSGLTPEELADALDGRPLVEVVRGTTLVETDRGATDVDATEADLTTNLAAGLVDLTDGRLPSAPGEVVVNRALADKGYAVGDRLPVVDADAPLIVGLAEDLEVRADPTAAGQPGSLAIRDDSPGRHWLVGGGPVTWDDVRALNAQGATVLSRAVLQDPPSESDVPASVRHTGSSDDAWLAVVALVVVMALIEVVLLAGPSFAVGARRRARDLALVAAAGGTPAQARRVVLASALVLGGVGSLGGVVIGIGLAAALLPIVQSLTDQWLGPFDLPRLHVLGIAAFGMLSAFLAAVVPAHLASRQDVVAVLAGRRGDRAPSSRSPVLGAVLLAAGVAGAILGSRPGGEVMIAASVIPAVLGMVLLVPVVLALLGRIAGRLPLSLRFAVRDAARHRTRTVPAVAAVAATVTGVVALGISTSSDAEQSRAMYEPSLPMGMGVLSVLDGDSETARDALVQAVPEDEIVELRGVATETVGDVIYEVSARPTGSHDVVRSSSGTALGSSVLVADGELPPGILGLDAQERAAAEQTLAEGRAVMFADQGIDADEVVLRVRGYDMVAGRYVSEPIRARLPVRVLEVDQGWSQPLGVLPSAVAQQARLPVTTVALAVPDADITEAQEETVTEVLTATSEGEGMYVERGPQTDDETVILQLVLAGLGALLMLGGTLTATFLALADARPDLATLAAVGASPRTRRGVAAAYALVVGLVGAVLGAAVGFVPGLAVTRPLTVSNDYSCAGDAGSCGDVGPFVDVPWLLILGIVLALPLLTAAVVGLAARSRLPLVSRLS
jgi:putative ABC transport system permease protein